MTRGVDLSLILSTFFFLSELVKYDQSFEIPGVKFPEVKGIPLVKGVTDELKLFIQFMQRFGKTYDDAVEQAKRFDIFKLNLKIIETLNKSERGTAIYGVTKFADLSSSEFQQKFGLKSTTWEDPLQRRSPMDTEGTKKTNPWSSRLRARPSSLQPPPQSVPTPPTNTPAPAPKPPVNKPQPSPSSPPKPPNRPLPPAAKPGPSKSPPKKRAHGAPVPEPGSPGSPKRPPQQPPSAASTSSQLSRPGAPPRPGQKIPTDYAYTFSATYPPVKDQGKCAACWAFCVAGALEILYAALTNKVVALSVQQLIDCSNGGDCKSGHPEFPIEYSVKEGVMMEKDYPYEQKKNAKCKSNPSLGVMKLSREMEELGGARAHAGETALGEAAAVAWLQKGPVIAQIHGRALQHYVDGAMDPTSCTPGSPITHAVVAVGHAISKDKQGNPLDVWIMRNSWGSNFGQKGHFLMVRGKGVCEMGRRLIGVTATLGDITQRPD